MKNKKQFYNLSKYYDLLYSKICDGYEIACFVNYNFRSLEGISPPSRDVCLIRRKGEYDIDFLAKGISYGCVSDYDKDKYSEKELFLSECKRMHVEWIDKIGFDEKQEETQEQMLYDVELIIRRENGNNLEMTLNIIKEIKQLFAIKRI